jgi:hypothetical protein
MSDRKYVRLIQECHICNKPLVCFNGKANNLLRHLENVHGVEYKRQRVTKVKLSTENKVRLVELKLTEISDIVKGIKDRAIKDKLVEKIKDCVAHNTESESQSKILHPCVSKRQSKKVKFLFLIGLKPKWT